MTPLPSFTDTVTVSPELALDAATAEIRGYCGWHIWPSITEILVLDGTGTSVFRVPTMMLTAVTALTETNRGAGQLPITLDVSTLEWSHNGLVWHPMTPWGWWTARARGLAVTVTHGYGDVPADLVRLSTVLASRIAANPGGLKAVTAGARSEQYNGSHLLLEEHAILDPYRRVV